MIVVTGGAGFIGSCVCASLNEKGREDLVIVDNLNHPLKEKNLANKKFVKYYDKKDFILSIKTSTFGGDVDCVVHMGACSSTTLQDAAYFQENNLNYTIALAEWCLKENIRFIYASSAATYGDGTAGYKDDIDTIRKCRPLNLYGESKQKFDEWVLEKGILGQVVGLKFFNVFGPNEYHKGDMRSVVAKAYQRVAAEGKISLFRSYHEGYHDGEQKRDFIYVKDAVDVVSFFIENPAVNGIFNVGTGRARSWNDLAGALFAAVGKPLSIEYIEMPEKLRGMYQYFTQADMSKLKAAGYSKPFTPLEAAVDDYVKYLKDDKHW